MTILALRPTEEGPAEDVEDLPPLRGDERTRGGGCFLADFLSNADP